MNKMIGLDHLAGQTPEEENRGLNLWHYMRCIINIASLFNTSNYFFPL